MKPTRLKRKKPINRVNKARKAKLYAVQFGKHAEFIRTLGCLVCGRVPSEPAHVKSRGAGGTKRDLVPLCGVSVGAELGGHHQIQHWRGVESFQRLYGLDLKAEAARLWELNGGDDG